VISASPRYAWPVVALALLAAVPVWIHAARRPVHDPCAAATQLAGLSRIGGMSVSTREVQAARPGAVVLEGGASTLPRGVDDLGFRLERSFEPEAVYGLASVRRFGSQYFVDLPVDLIALDTETGPIPVNWIESVQDQLFRLRAHVFVLDRKAVASPFLEGLGLAVPQLLGGTRPVTVLAFRAEGTAIQAEVMRERARKWLRGAWADYGRLCGG